MALRTVGGRIIGSGELRLAPLPTALATWAAEISSLVSAERIRDDVEAIAEPRSRLTAPEGMARAEKHIATALQAAGWETAVEPFAFSDVIGVRDGAEHVADPSVTYERLEGANVVARKRGTSGRRAILVGAHFDTVSASPGADDNASGVAALLELARVLGSARFEHDLLLVAFDMEEIGSFGARWLIRASTTELAAVIVFESIGYTSNRPGSQTLLPGIGLLYPAQVGRIRRRRLVGDWTLVIFRGPSLPIACAFAEALASLAGPDAVMTIRDPGDLPVLGGMVTRVAPWVRDFARSDHAEFWKAGVPAVQLTDTADFRNPNYHQPTDTPDTLDYARIAVVATATAVAVKHLDRG